MGINIPFRFATQQEWLALMQKLYPVFIVVAIIAMAIWLLRSIGYMRMAKKVGFADPWLAWIPGVNVYLFIKLAGGKKRKLGIAYLFMAFLGILSSIFIFCILAAPNIAFSMTGNATIHKLFVMNASMILGGILIFCIIMTLVVIRLILLYSIFKRFKPGASAAFIVLSIFFSFLEPIFIFVSSFGEPSGVQLLAEQNVSPTVSSQE